MLTLVHSMDYKPLCYIDENGASKGVLIDYWRLWSQKTGVPIRFEACMWSQCIARGRSEKNVLIPGIFYTPERDRFLDFSGAFMEVKTRLFVRKDLPVKTMKDLAGQPIGVTLGDRAESFLKHLFPSLRLKVYGDFESVMKAASEGELKAFAMDSLCAQYYLHQYGASDDFVPIETLYVAKFCAGLREGSEDLLRLVNYGIEQINREEVDNILENWLRRSGLISRKVLNLLLVAAGAFLFLVVLTGIIALKFQVKRRTEELSSANQALRESEERFRLLNEVASEGICLHDKGRILDANPALADMSGYEFDELMGMDGLNLVTPEWRDVVMENIVSGYDKPYTVLGLKKDGTTLPMEIQGRIVPYKGRRVRATEFRDITERVRAEKDKKQLEVQVQRLEKMEAIGTLAGGVAHDLNNILSGLVSYPELLLMNLPDDSPLRKPLSTIQKSGRKAADIVQDLLALARRGVEVKEIVNLNDIISEYLKSAEFQKLASFHPNVRLECHPDNNLLNVIGSPAHLSITAMNLISNAAEAMADGGKVTITTENRYIDKPIRGYDFVEEGDYVVLSVADTGIGISPKDMERIFEPFYTKKVMGRSGTGLGMAVVWGTVKDHNGYIDIQSAEGKGTTILLYFPATRQEMDEKSAFLTIDDYTGNGELVLVVDDVSQQREIASKILTELGYVVTTVASGEAALAYLENNTAELLVLDMIMAPGMDGLETYKEIIKRHPGQKAIIASGFSETDRVRETQRLGAGAYVKKPYTLETIGVVVKSELNK